MSRRALGALAGLAALMIAVQAVLASRLGGESDWVIMHFTWVEVLIYAVAAAVIWLGARPVAAPDGASAGGRGRDRAALALILGVGALLRAMLLPIDPVSTDINRYIWDGRVQAAGINPYLYVPADPALASLRDEDIYPEINRKTYAHTIYPPLAEIVFFLVTRVSETVTAMKTAMVGFELVAVAAMMALLRARRLRPTLVLLYLWHPLPIWEFAGSGHVDAIAIACVTLALAAAELKRPILSGMALGGAALVKYFPVAVAPAAYRRWDWKLPLAGAATVALLYVPYLGAGWRVFGFLSGYSAEEGLENGSGFYPIVLLRQVWPALPAIAVPVYVALAAATLGALGLVVLFRRRQEGADLGGAFLLAAAFTVLTSPHFPWYLAWLVPFLCFFRSWAVLWLTGAAPLMYILGWPPSFLGGSVLYLPFFGLAAGEETLRRRRA